MFDVYEKSDSLRRIIVKSKSGLPAHLNPAEWQLAAEEKRAEPDIVEEIEAKGFYQYKSNVPLGEQDVIGLRPW
jgi:hypothetical protein